MRKCLSCSRRFRGGGSRCARCKRQASKVKWQRQRDNYIGDWRSRRKLALERDGHRCTRCGATKDLTVHHKRKARAERDAGRDPHRLDNLVTLCRTCHGHVEGDA